MSFTRTSKGSIASKVNGTTLSIGSVAIAENASVIVCLGHDPVAVTSVKWNSLDLTKVQEETFTGSVQGSIWALHNCTAATGSVDVVFGSAIDAKAMDVIQLIGSVYGSAVGELGTDVSASGQGTGTSPSSGATAALTYENEFAIGMLAVEFTWGTGGTGTFTFGGQSPFTSGGADDTNISVADYFFNETGSSAVTFSNTGATSGDWVALVAVFYEAALQVVDAQQYRTSYYTHERVENAQQSRTTYYTHARVEDAQHYRTIWYVEPAVDDLMAMIIG